MNEMRKTIYTLIYCPGDYTVSRATIYPDEKIMWLSVINKSDKETISFKLDETSYKKGIELYGDKFLELALQHIPIRETEQGVVITDRDCKKFWKQLNTNDKHKNLGTIPNVGYFAFYQFMKWLATGDETPLEKYFQKSEE